MLRLLSLRALVSRPEHILCGYSFVSLTSAYHRCLVPTATSHALCTAHRLGFNHFTRCGPTARAHAIRGPRAVIRAKTD